EEAIGLAPAEVDKLLELLAVHQDRSSAVFDRARQSSNDPAAQPHVAAALEENRRIAAAELQQLLGSKYAQWQDYQQTRPAWIQRGDLQAVLNAAGTPLTDAQSRSLIATLSAEERSFRETQNAAPQPVSRNTPE